MWAKLWMTSRCCFGGGHWIESLCLRVCSMNGARTQSSVFCKRFKVLGCFFTFGRFLILVFGLWCRLPSFSVFGACRCFAVWLACYSATVMTVRGLYFLVLVVFGSLFGINRDFVILHAKFFFN